MSFWVCFIALLLNWSVLAWIQGSSILLISSSIIFFAGYFILPLVESSLSQMIYFGLPLMSILAFYPSATAPFLWLMHVILIFEYSFVSSTKAYFYYVILVISSLSGVLIIQNQSLLLLSVILLFSLVSYFFYLFKQTREEKQHYEKSFKQLSDHYTQIKRQMVSQEQAARQEERSHIARDIHDSVGHRLTALLMQLEVARHQASDEQTKHYFGELKHLAQESLHDTRDAVKALRSDETAGIQAIIHLIRKLEAESHLEIRFIIQSGVLGVKLSNEQSVAIYRSIQEALTNMMRHSQTKKATIEFVLLGERYLQFKVSHAVPQKVIIREGFGLTNMRNRLNELEGTVTLTQEHQQFKVIGQFPL